MAQVSLNTRISPETDKLLREWSLISGKSYATIVDEALNFHIKRSLEEMVTNNSSEIVSLKSRITKLTNTKEETT